MAITAGMEVALAVGTLVTDLGPALSRPGTVTFGLALSATPCEVAWYNGQFSTDIPEAQLDQIEGFTGTNNYSGRVVTFDGALSADYYGTVVREYTRDRNNAGAPVSFVLIRTRNGQTIEALASDVSFVDGQ